MRFRRSLAPCLALAFAQPAAGGPIFVDVAAEAGLDFQHFNGMSGEFYLVENLGGGVALLDYDNDGDLDVYMAQGRMLGKDKTLEDAVTQPPKGPLTDRLYRNDLVMKDGEPSLRLTDVTEEAGIELDGYGMGVAVGDYDNDGYPDLYITQYGPNRLLHNEGDGTFTEVSEAAGVADPRLGVSASFLDFDRDGRLDLYVGNYVAFSTEDNKVCYSPSSSRDYCSPRKYQEIPDRLYRNLGNGRFEDVSDVAGITREYGTALGVIGADFDADGWLDIYVGNDGMANQLWMNQGDGSFRNNALMSGTAVNMEGVAEASMGVTAADHDNDGDTDLFMTHLMGETNTVYVNNGDGWFQDRSVATDLASASKPYTAFGTGWFDYDNNGWLDLFAANGAVNIILSLVKADDPYPLHQPNQLFANTGDGGYRTVPVAEAGPPFELSFVSRGAAFGDLDNDGDTDIVVANNNGPARVLQNQIGARRHWLGLRLVGRHGREALGARVRLTREQGPALWRRVHRDGSYASASDPRVLFGLGDSTQVDAVQVHWPSGLVERWEDLKPDRYHRLREGEGQEVDS